MTPLGQKRWGAEEKKMTWDFAKLAKRPFASLDLLSALDAMGRAARKSHHRRRNKAMELPHATAEPVVSGTHRRRPRQNAQDHDYSVGSKTSDRALAAGDDRRSTGRFAHSTGRGMITWGSNVWFLQVALILMPSCS